MTLRLCGDCNKVFKLSKNNFLGNFNFIANWKWNFSSFLYGKQIFLASKSIISAWARVSENWLSVADYRKYSGFGALFPKIALMLNYPKKQVYITQSSDDLGKSMTSFDAKCGAEDYGLLLACSSTWFWVLGSIFPKFNWCPNTLSRLWLDPLIAFYKIKTWLDVKCGAENFAFFFLCISVFML